MKKFLVLALILVFAASASAVSVSLLSGGSSSITAAVGTVIQVDLVSDIPVISITSIDFDNPVGVATVSAVGAWNGLFTVGVNPGTLSGNDILRAQAGASAAVAAGTVLYSYSATVAGNGLLMPSMPNSYDNIKTTQSPGYFYTSIIGKNGLNITIPEPITIVLLGLGGLLLRRRK